MILKIIQKNKYFLCEAEDNFQQQEKKKYDILFLKNGCFFMPF